MALQEAGDNLSAFRFIAKLQGCRCMYRRPWQPGIADLRFMSPLTRLLESPRQEMTQCQPILPLRAEHIPRAQPQRPFQRRDRLFRPAVEDQVIAVAAQCYRLRVSIRPRLAQPQRRSAALPAGRRPWSSPALPKSSRD